MGTGDETLAQRVDVVLRSYSHQKILSTTGTRAAVEELSRRNEALETIVRELALEIERVAVEVAELRPPTTFASVRHPVPHVALPGETTT